MIEEGRGIELVDGELIDNMPQGKRHDFIFAALQRAFASMGLFGEGLVVQPTVVMEGDSVLDREFALLSLDAVDRESLPRAADVRWIVEVAVSSRNLDLSSKRDAYALSSIPHYWVVDGIDRGIWVFAEPSEGEYRLQTFYPVGSSVALPLLEASLNSESVFPASEGG